MGLEGTHYAGAKSFQSLPTDNIVQSRNVGPSGEVDTYYQSVTQSVVGVTAANQLVLAANLDRIHVLFINDSDTVVYLHYGSAAAVGQGIRLEANGGKYEMSRQLGNVYLGDIFAIHGTAAATKNVLVTEGVSA